MPYTHPETGLPKKRPCFRILGLRCGKAATDSKEGHRLVNQASPYRGGGRQAGEVAVYQYLSMIKSNLSVSLR